MFGRTKTPAPCRKYEARFEDYLSGAADAELAKHLDECVHCRSVFEDAQLAGSWLRDAWEPASEPHPAFLAGVMARIREEQLRAEAPSAFWSPLEFMASRLAMTAAALLLVLSGYLAASPQRQATPPSTRTELSAEEIPQPPADPVSNEEVLQSLSERSYGH